ncbi:MAG: sugar transferase [Chthonomonas sp.]|nr:sugar transferase [Chthonomonas sp.]
MSRVAYFRAKRLADIVVSATTLLLFSPVLLLVGIAVKVDSRGPALYRARRVGQYGEVFEMLKFRTMVCDAERLGPAVTAAGDPRITKLGALLRKTKLDEIPQFWNVLVGDMSIVGPRPNDPLLVADYTREEREILTVPHGITDFSSLWFRTQEDLHAGTEDVMADYRERVAPTKTRLGIFYAKNGSLKTDWNIFLATFLAVFFKKDPMWAFPKEAMTQTLVVNSQALADKLVANSTHGQ